MLCPVRFKTQSWVLSVFTAILQGSATFPVVVSWFVGDVGERPNMQYHVHTGPGLKMGMLAVDWGRGVFSKDHVE